MVRLSAQIAAQLCQFSSFSHCPYFLMNILTRSFMIVIIIIIVIIIFIIITSKSFQVRLGRHPLNGIEPRGYSASIPLHFSFNSDFHQRFFFFLSVFVYVYICFFFIVMEIEMDECDMFACLLPGLSRFLSVVWQYKQSPAKWLQPRLRHRVNGRIQIQLSSLISD